MIRKPVEQDRTAHSEPMSAVDAAWFGMDRPENPMVITGIVELKGRGGLRQLSQVIASRLLACPRFRQRAAPPFWVDDGEPELDYHVHTRRLADGSDKTLRAAIAAEMELPVDRNRPLWRCCLLVRRRGNIVLLFRAHHALADGVALMQLLLATRDGAAASPPWPESPAQPHGPLGGLLRRLESVNASLEAIGTEIDADLKDPARLVSQLHDAAAAARAITRMLRLPEPAPASLRRPLSGHRDLAWTSALRLGTLRAIARAHGTHVNDVFLAALSGAFSRLMQEEGTDFEPGHELRVSIPVNLRTAADGALGNRFGLVLADLPAGVADWRERLRLCAERMQSLKESGEARALLAGLAVAGHLPRGAGQALVDIAAGKSVAVVSNLPGPQQPIQIGGMRVSGMVFWPPQAGGIGVGVSLLSYAGGISMGVSADRAVLAEPARLVRAFEAEVESMQEGRRSPRQGKAEAGRDLRGSRKARAVAGASLSRVAG